eukprot:1158287-Pelagomonas_calceolata.AAC.4
MKGWGPKQAAKYAWPRSGKVEPGKEANVRGVVVGSESGSALQALAVPALQPISCSRLVAARANSGAAAGKPGTHAARRPLLTAVAKLGAQKGMDGEPDYDGQRHVPSRKSLSPCFSQNTKKGFP